MRLSALLVALVATIIPSTTFAEDPPPRIASAAARTRTPVNLDGRDDEPSWKEAAIIDAFRVFDPTEDGDPRFRTVTRIMYDNSNLYVHVRAFDPHPDSIVGLLSRRDVRTQSDYITVMIDSYHDRRTGYGFAVNPAGVQRDLYMYNDVVEDLSWDAV